MPQEPAYLSGVSPVVHLSGVQATIRVIFDVLRADRESGRCTAAFVSGYPGSPLAGFDRELRAVTERCLDLQIVHRPAVNEELAATAVMGSQLVSNLDRRRFDGVLGVWYGKAPGLDRSIDALRHANYAGASSLGGAVALVGDDPAAKSSTLPSASEAVLADLAMPVLFPRSLDGILELGQHAVHLSRWSGSWVAIKLATTVADSEGTAAIVPRVSPLLPFGYEASTPTGDLLTPGTVTREEAVLTDRIRAATDYGDLNSLNRITTAPAHPVVAIAAAGTVYTELIEALRRLGIGPTDAARLGIRLAEIRMPFPIGEGFARTVAEEVEEVVVVEERREVIEGQLLGLIARRRDHPTVIGRRDEEGRPLVARHGTLDAGTIARLLAPRLRRRFGEWVKDAPPAERPRIRVDVERVPWFCSGCPHSVSTRVPEGTLMGEGIGCHSIVHYMPPARVGRSIGLTQMGGEGAQWIGMAPFTDERHIVQNLGDGTFFHSGHLAVRAAVAAGTSITYKILWNGATAMTGGQNVVGASATPVQLSKMLLLEGVKEIVITTDDLSRYRRRSLPDRVSVRSRDDVIEVQESLARVNGVTVMIHDQACATELRRSRKRGLAPNPKFKVVINERVCEGCGDCQAKSNCLSLQTVDTTFGPKTRIDEDSCNVDLSCLRGDCPAFSLVKETPGSSRLPDCIDDDDLPAPPLTAPAAPISIRFAGIGGTGVVTAAHLLARAALRDGLEVWGLDQTGLSQKAGPVVSDLRVGPKASDRSNLVGPAEVDLLLATDLVAATQPAGMLAMSPERTSVVSSTSPSLSGPMVLGLAERRVPTAEMQAVLSGVTKPDGCVFVDAAHLARAVGVPTTMVNVIVLGVASQLGLLPVSVESIQAAIKEGGVAVDANRTAFAAGRRWAAGRPIAEEVVPSTIHGPYRIDDVELPTAHRDYIAGLAADLASYQGRRLAEQFLRLVTTSWAAERVVAGEGDLTAAVAFGYHKLLAYKDEYEVARLLLAHSGDGGSTIWLLHPPTLRSLGLKRKVRLGPWARPLMKLLRAGRVLRGHAIDPFGRTPLRRAERTLPGEYAAALQDVLAVLKPELLHAAIEIARLPDSVRGYETIKQESIERYRSELTRLLSVLMNRAGSAEAVVPSGF